jgi:outer membrane protein assembly factor BamB
MRWWMPVAILVLAGGAIAYFQLAEAEWDDATRFVFCLLTGTAAVLLLAAWYILFTGLRWWTRLALAGAIAAALVALGALFKIDGATGNMHLRFAWRWGTPSDADVADLVATTEDGIARKPLDVTPLQGEFPQFLGPTRLGVVAGAGLDRNWSAHPPREVWRKTVGRGWGSFAVVGELAVSLEQHGTNEYVVGRDRANGDVRWWHRHSGRFSEPMGGDGPRSTPTVAGGKVYALGAEGVLDCLDADTGKPLWSKDTLTDAHASNLQWGKSCSPLVIDDPSITSVKLVVVSLGQGGDGTLAAYDFDVIERTLPAFGASTVGLLGSPSGQGPLLAASALSPERTKERKWVGGTDQASYSSPVLAKLAGKWQIISMNHNTVTGHDPEDGKVLWEYHWDDNKAPAKASQPIPLPGDRLLLLAGYNVYGVVIKIEDDQGKLTPTEVYRTNKMRTKFTTAVVRDHYAYGLDDGRLACIDLDQEGKQVWLNRTRFGDGQVLLAGDLLIVQGEVPGDVYLVAADPSGYRQLGVIHPFEDKTWNVPSLAGHTLFVRNDREAACYQLPAADRSEGK